MTLSAQPAPEHGQHWSSGTTTIFLRSEHQASSPLERGLWLALQSNTDTNTEHTTIVLNSTHKKTPNQHINTAAKCSTSTSPKTESEQNK